MQALVNPPAVNEARRGDAGLVQRFRQRIFPAKFAEAPVAGGKQGVGRKIGFNASIAEFLLINRLKARSQKKAQAAEMMERASHIVFVTCKNWFAVPEEKSRQHRTML